MRNGKAPLPVAQRPRCLYCDRPLRAQFDWPEESQVPSEILGPRTTTTVYFNAVWDWRKANKFFSGHYGDYKDDRFCGLNCGYHWAVNHSKPAKAHPEIGPKLVQIGDSDLTKPQK